MATLPELVRAIDDGPGGPQVGALFDLDGTIVDGYTAAAFYRDRLRRLDIGAGELARSIAVFADSMVGGDPSRLGPIAIAGLRGQSRAALEEIGERLFDDGLRRTIRPHARELIDAHRRRGHTITILSSATRFQSAPIAREVGVENVICSEVEVDDDGNLTGAFNGGMVWGPAKARAARRFARERDLDLRESFAYANGDEDVAFLSTVGRPCAVSPGPILDRAAKVEGWPVVSLPGATGTGVREAARTAAAVAGMNAALAVALGVGLVKRDRSAATNLAGSFAFDVALKAAGVGLRVTGRENLWDRRPAVFVFNHQSNLDPIVASALVRRDFTATGKKEAKWDPGSALAGHVLNAVFLDREDPDRAKEQLAPLVDRLHGGTSVLIAPEGTRTPTPMLGEFKHGAFHVAMQAGAPVVPIVLRNSGDLMTRGSMVIRPGTIDVCVLKPVDTSSWTKRTLAGMVHRIRSDYARTLEAWPA